MGVGDSSSGPDGGSPGEETSRHQEPAPSRGCRRSVGLTPGGHPGPWSAGSQSLRRPVGNTLLPGGHACGPRVSEPTSTWGAALGKARPGVCVSIGAPRGHTCPEISTIQNHKEAACLSDSAIL